MKQYLELRGFFDREWFRYNGLRIEIAGVILCNCDETTVLYTYNDFITTFRKRRKLPIKLFGDKPPRKFKAGPDRGYECIISWYCTENNEYSAINVNRNQFNIEHHLEIG